jgi:hypothetical protein
VPKSSNLLPEKRYEFSGFTLDVLKLEMYAVGDGIKPIRLQARLQVLRAFIYLIENRDRVVDAEELWSFAREASKPGSYSDEVGRTLIYDCRSLLGDAGKQCIRSIAPKLYRFVCDVKETRLVASPTIGSNLAQVTAERGSDNRVLVSGIENVAGLMKDAFAELPIMDQLGKVYEAQHIDRHSDYINGSLTVTARCLLNAGEPESDLPDLVHYSAKFKTLEHPIYCRCLSVSVPRTNGSKETMNCTLIDLDTGTEISTTSIPVRSRHASSRREWLVFFDPVLPPNSGPFRIDVQYLVPGFLRPLKENGKDELTHYLRRAPGRRVNFDIILYAPASFRRIVMLPKVGRTPGRPMTPLELISHGPPPPRFRGIGWTDIVPDEGADYGVDLKCE